MIGLTYIINFISKVDIGVLKWLRVTPRRHRCKKCGTLHKWAECIAFGKKCLKCGKLGHFAKCCRTPRKVEAITDKEDHSQFVGGITQKAKTDTDENGCDVTVNIQDTPIRFKLDTSKHH